jgi:uncharacterized repeat protein (TIGR03803 family)
MNASDGSSFQVIHSFTGNVNDGSGPTGGKLVGTTLFGTTQFGSLPGPGDYGSVYTLNINSGGYSRLHTFTGGDGGYESGNIVVSGNTIFGTNAVGATLADGGTLYSMTTGGGSFLTQHGFTGAPSDGANPYGGVVLAGGKLYGATQAGGTNSLGTVYSINTDGTGYQVLHSFAGGASDGSFARGKLLVIGSTIYGTTIGGGASNLGTVFAMDTDGSNFEILHSFAGGAADGSAPFSGLVAKDSLLYGVTSTGGAANKGALFSMSLAGGPVEILHAFGGLGDGATPRSELLLDGNFLYGTTDTGGASNRGVVFSYLVPEPTGLSTAVLGLAAWLGMLARRFRRTGTR